MKVIVFIGILLVFAVGCQEKKKPIQPRSFTTVVAEPVLEDSTLSIRAIDIMDVNSVAFAANNNTYGLYNISKDEVLRSQVNQDSLSLEFRIMANNGVDVFIMSVGSPGLLFKTGDAGKMELVYKEDNPKTFYDSMEFWNTNEGIAIGDATDDCLSVIITRDGGNTWTKLSCDLLPNGMANEGAFAASNTNIAIVGDQTWVATTMGRVYYSPDKGHTWEVFDTPIVKEKETEGIYSMDFYDGLNGLAIGGDYTQPDQNTANKIRTKDGGKTWELIGANEGPGYRSCVQYVPNREGKELVAIGFKGIDFSNDGGSSWNHLSDEGFYTIRFLNDSIAYAAGRGRISKLTFKE